MLNGRIYVQNMYTDERLVLQTLVGEAAHPVPDHAYLKMEISDLSKRLNDWADGSDLAEGSASRRASVLSSLKLILLLSELATLERRDIRALHSLAAGADVGRAAEDANADLASFIVEGVTSGALPYGIARHTLEAQHARPRLSSLLYNASPAVDRARFMFNMTLDGIAGDGAVCNVLGAVEPDLRTGLAPSLVALLGPPGYSDVLNCFVKDSYAEGLADDAANSMGLLWSAGEEGLSHVTNLVRHLAQHATRFAVPLVASTAAAAVALSADEICLEEVEFLMDVLMCQTGTRQRELERTETLCGLLRLAQSKDGDDEQSRLKGVQDRLFSALGLTDDNADYRGVDCAPHPIGLSELSEQLEKLNGQARSLRQLHEHKLIDRNLYCDLCRELAHFEDREAAGVCDVHHCGHVFHKACLQEIGRGVLAGREPTFSETLPHARAIIAYFVDGGSNRAVSHSGCLLCSGHVMLRTNMPL